MIEFQLTLQNRKQNFFKEVNKRKERQRQELKEEDAAKRAKLTDNL